MKKPLYLLAAALVLYHAISVNAQTAPTGGTLDPWRVSSTTILPRNTANTVQIPSNNLIDATGNKYVTSTVAGGGITGVTSANSFLTVDLSATNATLTATSAYVGSFNGATGTIVYAPSTTIPTAYVATNTGNWAGTWQLKSPSDFLASSTNLAPSTTIPTVYVATNTGNWNGTWKLLAITDFLSSSTVVNTPSTTIPTVYVATNTGNWAGTWQLKSPSDFLASSTVVNTPSTTIPTVFVRTLNGSTGTYNLYAAGTGLTVSTGTASTTFTWTNPGYITTSTYNASITIATVAPLAGGASLANNSTISLTIATTTFLMKADNLSGLANTSTARTNLGLGSIATFASTDYVTSSTGATHLTKAVTSINGASSTGQTVVGSGVIGVATVSGATNSTTTVSCATCGTGNSNVSTSTANTWTAAQTFTSSTAATAVLQIPTSTAPAAIGQVRIAVTTKTIQFYDGALKTISPTSTAQWIIENPTTAEDDAFFIAPYPGTLTGVSAVNKSAGDTATFNIIWHASRANASSTASHAFTSNQAVTATTTITSVSVNGSSTFAAGDVFRFVTSAASSSQFTMMMYYTPL